MNLRDAAQLVVDNQFSDRNMREAVKHLDRALEADRDGQLYRHVQRACCDLPFGWEITINLEKNAGTVSLFNPDGDEEEFPSNREHLANELSDAIDAAIAAEKGEAAR